MRQGITRWTLRASLWAGTAAIALLAACSDDTPPPADPDAGAPDAAVPDATPEPLPDAAPDASPVADAGPPPGDGGAGDGGVEPPGPPAVNVVFPPSAATLTRGASLALRGTALPEVAALQVAGVEATLLGDGAWEAEVALTPGDNALALAAEDADGAPLPVPAALNVRYQPELLSRAEDMIIDREANRAYLRAQVAPPAELGLWTVDLATGEASILGSADVGSGPWTRYWGAMALDAARSRLLLADPPSDRIVSLDLATGERVVLSPADAEYGPAFGTARDMVIDEPHNRALFTDNSVDALFAMDLSTGQRTILSDNSHPGPSLINPGALVYDAANDRALVAHCVADGDGDEADCDLLAVDLSSGARTVFDVVAHQLENVVDMALDLERGRLITVRDDHWELRSVALDTGETEVLSSNPVGAGLSFERPEALALAPDGERVLVLSREHNAIVAVAPDTGERAVEYGFFLGAGVPMGVPQAITLEPTGNSLLLAHERTSSSSRITRVDIASGLRTAVSEPGVHEGPWLYEVVGMAYDSGRDEALVVIDDFGVRAMAVDRDTGVRRALAGPDDGTGTAIYEPTAIAYDPDFDRAIVAMGDSTSGSLVELRLDDLSRRVLADGSNELPDEPIALVMAPSGGWAYVLHAENMLSAVSLDSGEVTVVSDAVTGSGPPLYFPRAIAWQSQPERLLVLGWHTEGGSYSVFAVDPSTGDRTELGGALTGVGAPISSAVAMAFDESADIVWVSDRVLGIVALDLRSGDRVTVSR